MRPTRQSKLDDESLDKVRADYESGSSVPALIKRLCATHEIVSPFEVMYVLMDAFYLGLGDVSCIDGWWPPSADGEVTDEKLDRFVREAIEALREEWSR